LHLCRFSKPFRILLPRTAITTVKKVQDSSFDIQTMSRLNKLYVELLNDNPDWGKRRAAPRHEPFSQSG